MTVDLSIIVPVYNEEDSVRPLHAAVTAAASRLGLAYELIVVDDGSQDGTFAQLAALAARDRRLRVVKLRRNYGQTAAMIAGIDHAGGRVLVTMDGDLQNDPADIPLFLDKLDEGFDVVVGWRHRRQDRFWSRRLPSIAANWLIGKITGVPIKDNGCSLKAYRAEVVRRVPLYAEMHRFIPAVMSLAGVRLAEIKVRHHPRRFGRSKYGMSRVYKVCLDLITIKTLLTFARRPLLWFASGAGLAALVSLAAFAVALLHGIGGSSPSIVFTTIAGLFGSLAVFLLALALIGQMVFNTAARRFAAMAKPRELAPPAETKRPRAVAGAFL